MIKEYAGISEKIIIQVIKQKNLDEINKLKQINKKLLNTNKGNINQETKNND